MTLPAVIRPEDLRMQMSHLASTFAAPLSQANLNAGKSWRPVGGVLPEPVQRFARQAAGVAFTGHEYAVQQNEREIQRDVQVSLVFELNSWLAGFAAAFLLDDVASVQEGSTGHYTHTCKPVNLLASGNGMLAKLTDIYFDAGSADANRRKFILLALALQRFSISGRIGGNCQIAMDFLGSGKEDTATAITLAALSTEVLLGGEQWKFERGDTGGALTDITDRIREWTFECVNEIDAERGYTPNVATLADAKYRRQFRVLRRRFSLSWTEEVDRAQQVAAGGPRARALARTRTETKITIDSGVQAGTGTDNHGMEIRIPDHRLPVVDPQIGADGAVLPITVPMELMYPDAGIGNVPLVVTVENDQASYRT